MPWTAHEMSKKGAKRPAIAAKVANEILARTGDEGKAIRMGLAASNKPKRRRGRGRY